MTKVSPYAEAVKVMDTSILHMLVKHASSWTNDFGG
jgi:hypothetical protein